MNDSTMNTGLIVSLTNRVQGIEPSGIRRILELADQAENPVDMSIGQPDFDVPAEIKEACSAAITQGFNRYTLSAGIPELREAILEKQRSRGAFCEDVMITCGAAGAMVLFFLALVEEGDNVVMTDPYFLNYRHLVTISGASARFIDTYPDFRIRRSAVQEAVGPDTKMIVVNSPGNPTGMVHSREELEWIVEAAQRQDCWILSDEVYDCFVYDGIEFVSPAQLYEKTLVVTSFSKSAGMPGWRLGYGTGPRDLITKIIPLQQYFYGCAHSASQKAGLLCVNRDVSEDLERLSAKRDLVYEGLRDVYELQKPEGAFYVFAKAPGDDCYPFLETAIRNNVFVSPGDTFSKRKTHFRISYAIPEEDLKRGIDILRSIAS